MTTLVWVVVGVILGVALVTACCLNVASKADDEQEADNV